MPFAQIDGGNLHYQFDGDPQGPVLLLSNSLGTNLSIWDGQLAALGRTFRVLRYDSRGHGRSLVTPGPYTIGQLGRDVVSLLVRLEIPRVHFCGLSLGGMVGMWLACREPSRVQRLVLANTAALMGPRDLWDKRIEAVRAAGMTAIADSVIERWLTPAFRESHPAQTESLRAMLLGSPPEGYSASCAAIRDMDQRGHLAEIHAPTLVITGTHDPATPPALGRAIADVIPDSRYVELPAAHMSNIEVAGAFNDAVAQFFLT
jgi:3-oxoadipate enol-lactonase